MFKSPLFVLPLLARALCAVPAHAEPAADANEIAAQVVAGTDPAAIAAGLDERSLGDEHLLNAVRLHLKAAGHAPEARRLLSALAARQPSDAVLYNLSLAYIDQLPGHNLLNKGYLSSASVRVVDEILARRPDDWLALHIRGLNNLYWPDWFDKSPIARTDLTHAVAVGQPMLEKVPEQDGLAWSYLGLGDALALLDKPAEARAAWVEGARAYPYFAPFAARAALDDATQHASVRAERDSDKPVDTDLDRIRGVSGEPHRLDLVGGILFGPGPLDDQKLPLGGLKNLRFARPLTGTIAHFNNGAAEPHMPGEIAVGKKLDGLFSDGTPVNKNIDVGHVFLLNGRFKLFLAALGGGPNHGVVHFYLDRFWNWTIQDDIGIDPGFPAGVIKFTNFTFSTSPRVLPTSTQTQAHEPAGVDRAGSLASGAVVPGLLGDDEATGKLAGTFNAIGSFPLDSVFLPGAPFAQTRVFQTDLDVSPQVAGFLTLANAISYLRAASATEAAATGADAAALDRAYHDRLRLAAAQFARAGAWVDGLDSSEKAAYARLMAPLDTSTNAATRTRFVCDANGDLAVLGARLGLIHSDRDGSHLGDLVRCETR